MQSIVIQNVTACLCVFEEKTMILLATRHCWLLIISLNHTSATEYVSVPI